jgi:hypothetical protein
MQPVRLGFIGAGVMANGSIYTGGCHDGLIDLNQ